VPRSRSFASTPSYIFMVCYLIKYRDYFAISAEYILPNHVLKLHVYQFMLFHIIIIMQPCTAEVSELPQSLLLSWQHVISNMSNQKIHQESPKWSSNLRLEMEYYFVNTFIFIFFLFYSKVMSTSKEGFNKSVYDFSELGKLLNSRSICETVYINNSLALFFCASIFMFCSVFCLIFMFGQFRKSWFDVAVCIT
jgi:hypothetical protein